MIEIIATEDGSHSLYVPELDETYHSRHGALQESQHVFIKHGLRFLVQSPKRFPTLRILEVGFGTGLNAILTLPFSVQQSMQYTTLETFPLSIELVEQLNYTRLLSDKNMQSAYMALHLADWNKAVMITEKFELSKRQMALQEFTPEDKSLDLIYFDAFAPNKQPELWTAEIMQKMFDGLDDDGVLVTYCAKGQLKRDLKSVGFVVETLQGPPGKKEMIRAIKS